MKKYFFPLEKIETLSYPPERKWFLTGLWNKNSMRYEWFMGFKKAYNRLGYTAYRIVRSDYWNKFETK